MSDPVMDEFFDTTSYDEDEDWAKFPELQEEPDETDQSEPPEHINDWLGQQASGETTLAKAMSEEQRLVTGWASVITEADGSPVVDHEGDTIDEEELVKAAEAFMRVHRRMGDNHKRKDGIGTVVESFVITKAVRAALGLPDTFPTGWLITAKVHDETVWQKVKSGEYKGFSIGGGAIREAIT